MKLTFTKYADGQMHKRAYDFYRHMNMRRTVRNYTDKPIPKEIIEQCLLTAGTAPSGANRQPWHFAVVSDPVIKHKIRLGAEKEEREFYQNRASQDWIDALVPLGTDEHKPFLEIAHCLIVIFGQKFELDDEGNKHKNYYVSESVGIASGMLITALHNAGLATLTHTPSPMNFLNDILDRPESEKPVMILVAGYPTENAEVPDITRKSLADISSFHTGS